MQRVMHQLLFGRFTLRYVARVKDDAWLFRAVQDALAHDVPASAVRAHETTGYGSTARWARDDRQA